MPVLTSLGCVVSISVRKEGEEEGEEREERGERKRERRGRREEGT